MKGTGREMEASETGFANGQARGDNGQALALERAVLLLRLLAQDFRDYIGQGYGPHSQSHYTLAAYRKMIQRADEAEALLKDFNGGALAKVGKLSTIRQLTLLAAQASIGATCPKCASRKKGDSCEHCGPMPPKQAQRTKGEPA